MAQETLVLKLTRDDGSALQRNLETGVFEFRTVPHATLSVKGEGVVATLYGSGKLVVQGPDPGAFVLRFLGRAAPTRSAAEPSDHLIAELERAALVGSDEAGKGDWLGPLTVAAVRVEPDDAARLREGGVMDSKRLSDARVLRLAAGLRERFPHAIVRLDPPAYNRRYAEVRNLNPLLAGLHAEALTAAAEPGDSVLVDRFADEALMRAALTAKGLVLHQVPRGERAMAVAAASILARAAFLEGLAELSEAFGVDLAKGAGPPADRAGRAFVRLHGRARLGEVAKLHFQSTQKLDGGE